MKTNCPQVSFHKSRKIFFTIFSFFIFIILTGSEKLFCQTDISPAINDAQIWENFNMDKKINRSWTARFSHEGRFTNNDSRLTYYFEDIGMEYKLHFFHLSVVGDYVFIRKLTSKANAQEYWDTRHQYYVALMWAKKMGQFEFHDRQMLMGQVKDVLSSRAGKIPDYYLRNKFSVKYNFNYYWSVYAAEELYWHVSEPKPDPKPHLNRVRYFIGGYYKLNERHEFELYYLIEQHMHIVNPNHNFILGVGYSYSFK